MISAAVRGLIAQRRDSAGSVAAAAGINRATLYRKMGNASPWLADEVDRLARYFQVSRDSLYEGRSVFDQTRARHDSNVQPSDPKGAWRLRRAERRRRLSVVPLYLIADDMAIPA